MPTIVMGVCAWCSVHVILTFNSSARRSGCHYYHFTNEKIWGLDNLSKVIQVANDWTSLTKVCLYPDSVIKPHLSLSPCESITSECWDSHSMIMRRAFLKNNFIYVSVFGCSEMEPLSNCSAWASHCGKLSCCGVQAPGPLASVVEAPEL